MKYCWQCGEPSAGLERVTQREWCSDCWEKNAERVRSFKGETARLPALYSGRNTTANVDSLLEKQGR